MVGKSKVIRLESVGLMSVTLDNTGGYIGLHGETKYGYCFILHLHLLD